MSEGVWPTLLHGDCREVLKGLEAESIHVCVTSPPYFGLRAYGTEPQIWGGDADCEHAWVSEPYYREGGGCVGSHEAFSEAGPENAARIKKARWREDTRCSRCGAWRGELGGEPTPEMWVENLVAVFREVRRVLRSDGVLFLNVGDAYFSGAQRGAACDTSGKEPEGSQDHDCLCKSLCDGCRRAYQIGKSHSDGQRDPMRVPSPYAPTQARKGSSGARPPTLGSLLQAGHSGVATRDPQPEPTPAADTLRGAPASTTAESSPLPRGECLAGETPDGGCRLCGHSLAACVPASERMKGCPCALRPRPPSTSDRPSNIDGSAVTDGSSDSRRAGKASALAYPYYTTSSRLKNKDLLGLPWLLAFALRADGWYLRSDIIWEKPNPMPESVTDRPTRSHEYLFLLTKSERYYMDMDAIREPHKTAGDPRNRADYTPKRGMYDSGRPDGMKGPSGASTWPVAGRNRRTVWEITPQPTPEAHFATFPEALVEPCILTSPTVCCPECGAGWKRTTEARDTGKRQKMADGWDTGSGGHGTIHRDGRQKGETGKPVMEQVTIGWEPTCSHVYPEAELVPATVLDPFLGSGTTARVAMRLGRRSIGIDLSSTYLEEIARRRTEQGALGI